MPELKHFASSDVKISREQAGRVLKFFFPDQPINAGLLTDDDIGFAQALLVEAVDASTEMGYVQLLFDKFYMKPPTDFSFIEGIIKSLCKQAMQDWFRHATGDDLKDPKIYESVRAQLARNFRSIWAIRLQTGELTY